MFKSLAAAAVGLVAVVAAQDEPFNPIFSPDRFEVWEPGTSQTITWAVQPEEYADETISLVLIGGPEQDLQVPLLTIAEGVANTDEKYEWDLPEDIGGEAWYGIKIVLESDTEIFQFSNPFNITAPEGGSDSTASPVPTSTADDTETSTVVEPTESATDDPTQQPDTTDPTVTTSGTTGVPEPTDGNTNSITGVPSPTDETNSPAETSTVPTETAAAARATGGVAALFGVAAIAALAL